MLYELVVKPKFIRFAELEWFVVKPTPTPLFHMNSQLSISLNSSGGVSGSAIEEQFVCLVEIN